MDIKGLGLPGSHGIRTCTPVAITDLVQYWQKEMQWRLHTPRFATFGDDIPALFIFFFFAYSNSNLADY